MRLSTLQCWDFNMGLQWMRKVKRNIIAAQKSLLGALQSVFNTWIYGTWGVADICGSMTCWQIYFNNNRIICDIWEWCAGQNLIVSASWSLQLPSIAIKHAKMVVARWFWNSKNVSAKDFGCHCQTSFKPKFPICKTCHIECIHNWNKKVKKACAVFETQKNILGAKAAESIHALRENCWETRNCRQKRLLWPDVGMVSMFEAFVMA